ncbi:hypothetical protein MP228_008121 [Amoeboaphelidium protococcarum]|nr:hypothetical protein MP228_008121 [Amoeboaphelidium protococcarum]
MKSFIISALLAASASYGFVVQRETSAPLFIQNDYAEAVPQEYIVVLKEQSDLSSAQIMSDLVSYASIASDDILHTYDTVLSGFAAKLSEDQLSMMGSRQEIAFIEPNQVVYAHAAQSPVPSWGLARVSQKSFKDPTTYSYPSTAGAGVDAYVIDTGVNIEHVDFEGRAKWGKTIPRGSRDFDGNGHGTHVAGTIAGKTFGIAKKANIVAVKVLSDSGSGTTADVIAGIQWSAEQSKSKGKKSVANMSLGGGKSNALNAAVAGAIKQGLQFAVAAGNSNRDACYYSPASVPTAISVGASTVNDGRAYFSNYGKCVHIMAPGQDITSAWTGSATAQRTISGTSMASPHVCGVMALLLAEEDLSPADLKTKIINLGVKGVFTRLPAGTPNLLLNNGYCSNESTDLFW